MKLCSARGRFFQVCVVLRLRPCILAYDIHYMSGKYKRFHDLSTRMRSGLLAIGVILFIIGTVFYFIPFAGTTGTVAADGMGVRNVFAGITIPPVFSLITMLIGLALIILGIAIPDGNRPIIVTPENHHTIRDRRIIDRR